MTTTRYYINSTLYPTILAVLLTLVFSVVNRERLTSVDSLIHISLTLMTSFTYSIVQSISCLTIFLINIDVIKRNKLLTALSWFLIPFFYIATVLTHQIKFSLRYNDELGVGFVYIILLILPFIAGLIWTYLRYRQNNYSQLHLPKSSG